MSDFTIFDKARAPFTGEAHLTVQKRGTITLNAASFALLDSPDAVELLFDPNSEVLGLRTADATLSHVAYVRKSTRSTAGPWVVSAMAFVRHFGIDTTVARQRVAYLDGDGVLCARMDEPGLVVSRTIEGRAGRSRRPRPGPGLGHQG